MDVEFVERFARVVGLPQLKACRELEGFELVRKGSRLSVMPVSDEHWALILQMAG